MNRASSVVEINGNRYDAATGQLLGTVKKGAHQLRSSASGVVDGFIRQSSATTRKKVARERLKNTAQNVHKSAQRSKTLMRTAVTKPSPKEIAKPTNHGTQPSPAKPRIFYKHSLRAKATQQHKQVKRFGHIHKSSNSAGHAKKVESINRTGNKVAATRTATPPSMITSATHSQIERLLDQALISTQKKSDEKSKHSGNVFRRVRLMPKWLSIGGTAFVLALLAGFFAWQNVPQVAIKVASTRASVNASVPSYTPEGYKFVAPISYTKGLVTVRYQSGSGQSYEITQEASKLDSTSLASTVLSAQTNVQTSQVKGNTVYIYGDKNDATWVNNGVRYTITDQAGLDSNQILRIAGSL